MADLKYKSRNSKRGKRKNELPRWSVMEPTKISKVKELGEEGREWGRIAVQPGSSSSHVAGSEYIGDSVLGVDAIFEVDASAITASVGHLHCKTRKPAPRAALIQRNSSPALLSPDSLHPKAFPCLMWTGRPPTGRPFPKEALVSGPKLNEMRRERGSGLISSPGSHAKGPWDPKHILNGHHHFKFTSFGGSR